ncbi:MAG: PHP domain-containing protein [Clostridiales bacterium]|nr:PHP domain-containing protein [Clostridiales bacterium]
MKGDLHMHSYYSDGFYSPAVVMEKARDAGCEIVALTDHDTIDGVAQAREAALRLGMRYVTGVELSAYEGTEVHILGYGVHCDNARFCDFIAAQKERRRARADKLLRNLAERGMALSYERLRAPLRGELSRTHIAAELVREGYESDFHEAIRKWLHKGSPTFVPVEGVSPEAVIEEIHAAGGVAVLAHPVRLDMEPIARTAFIRRLAAAGLDGIEAVYKRSSRATVKAFRALAAALGLFVTAGADYHGDRNEIIARPLSEPCMRRITE